MRRWLLWLGFLVGQAAQAQAQSQPPTRPDFAGVDRFWPILDQLSADREPSPAEWRHLLDAPVYRQLERDARLQRYFRMAFQPSHQARRDSTLAAGGYNATVVRHLQRVPALRAMLQQYRDSLAAHDLVQEATHLAVPYLPRGQVARRAPPALAFGLFGAEAYGESVRIAMDLLYARGLGPSFLPTVAHEVHHARVDDITRFRLPARSAPEFTLLQALRNLANEGTADRINLHFPVSPPAMTAEATPAYNAAYDSAETTLRDVDAMLAGLGGDSAKTRRTGADVSARLVYAGHPVGAYMAEQIEKQLGRADLVAAVGNPFAFLRAYDRAAARQSGKPAFSAATWQLLTGLERQTIGQSPG